MNESQTLGGGRYVLVKRLGEGGMATVWRAFDQRLQVWRAVKVLLPEYSVKPKILARFSAEAQTMALLEHPNIVRVYDVEIPVEGVNENGDPPFIVMELVEGGSLVDWLEMNGPMPPRMAVDVVVASCQALEVAHARNVIHRDIKPHNIMVDRDGVVRLTDFGIARAADVEGKASLTRTGAVMGTLGYMAPEQKSDAKHLDARADIYAMAATLYSLLTDRTPMDLFASEKDATLLEGIPDPLVPILVKATEYQPNLRYSTAREFAAALLKVREELEPNPEGTPPLVRPLDAPPPPPVSVPEATRYGTKLTGAKSQPSGSYAAIAPPGGATLLPDDAEKSGNFLTMPPVETDNINPAKQERATWTPPAPAPAPAQGRGGLIGGVVAIAALSVALAVMVFRPAAPVVVTVPAPTVAPPADPVTPMPAPVPAPAAVEAPAPTPAPVLGRPGGRRPSDPAPAPNPGVPRVDDHLINQAPAPAPTPAPAPAPVEVAQCFTSVPVPTSAAVGSSVPFRAKTCKEGSVTLFYRAAGSPSWFQRNLRLALGSYSTTITLDPSLGETVEWYLGADGVTWGSASAPKTLKVTGGAP